MGISLIVGYFVILAINFRRDEASVIDRWKDWLIALLVILVMVAWF